MWQKYVNRLQSFFNTTRRFRQYVRPQKKKLLWALLSGVAYTVMGILEPWPLKLIFDALFYDLPLPKMLTPLQHSSKNDVLYVLVLAIVLIALMRGMFYYYQQLLMARAGQQIVSKIRVNLFEHIQKLSLNFHSRRKTGDLLTRLTSDIRMLRQILISLPLSAVTDLMLMSAMVVVMSFMNLQLTMIALAIVPILVALMRRYSKPMRRAMLQQREREGTLSTIASETLGAIRVVQGFGREKQEVSKFQVKDKDTLKSGLKTSRLEAKLKWASEISVSLVTAIILLIAGRQVLQGNITPGDLLVFTYYLRMFNRPLRRSSKYMEQISRSSAAGIRIVEILNQDASVQDKAGCLEAGKLRGEITLENVSLIYRGSRPALKDLSLTIRAGEKVAIWGATGSGKTSLVSLLPRFWDPTTGVVKIDGTDIREFSLQSLRNNISIVFQEPLLFGTTISENIGYGRPDATKEEIIEAAKQAGIHEIIDSLEDGYETVIGERGCILSGGQRQCVAIARAMIKQSSLLILDEPTSGLDGRSARLVLQALQKLMEGKTCILITHQKELLPGMERIIKLQSGKLCKNSSIAIPV